MTGPAAGDVTDDVLPADDVMFVHVSDVRRLLTSLEPGSAADVSPTLPVVLYIARNETSPGKVVLELMPSIDSLRNNEVCRLNSRDPVIGDIFTVEQKPGGLSSVVFSRAVSKNEAQHYQLAVSCESTLDTEHSLQPAFTVYLHVHLL